MNAYNYTWSLDSVCSHEEAIRVAVKQPQPRFWISPEEAAREVGKLEKGKQTEYHKGSNKYEALMHVYENYKRLRKRRFRTESIAFVTAFACLEPAPRFFISECRARRIIDKIKKGEYIVID